VLEFTILPSSLLTQCGARHFCGMFSLSVWFQLETKKRRLVKSSATLFADSTADIGDEELAREAADPKSTLP
jgi:hypothetical protein